MTFSRAFAAGAGAALALYLLDRFDLFVKLQVAVWRIVDDAAGLLR